MTPAGSMPAGLATRAQRITSALQRRVWRLNRDGNPASRQIVVLSDGQADAVETLLDPQIDTEGAGGSVREATPESFSLAAPTLLWLGGGRPVRLETAAGTTGYIAEIDQETIVDAIGDQAEAVNLRYMVDRSFLLSLTGQRTTRSDIVASLEAILRELAQPQRGSPMLLSAHVRILLVSMMRISGVEEVALRSHGARSDLLQRFRQLVEMHFREHWTVAAYARTLGIAPDRLHAICTAQLAKTPKALIAERVAREAGLRLERSSLTIEQLSHSLGFRDPAHFSNFFKRTTGMRPGEYRRLMAAPEADRPATSPTGFADWP